MRMVSQKRIILILESPDLAIIDVDLRYFVAVRLLVSCVYNFASRVYLN